MADYIKALLGFSKYSPGELRDFARGTYLGLKDNSAFPEPPVAMQDLDAKIEAVAASIVATLDGGKKAYAERNGHLDELRNMLVQNGYYVEAKAPDAATFLSSGYKLASGVRIQTPPVNEAIRNFDNGENSGTFRFRFMAVPGADSYQLRWAPELADGTPGEWVIKPFGKTKAYVTFSGFTPGTRYLFQVRAVMHTEYTDWSDPVTKMAQ